MEDIETKVDDVSELPASQFNNNNGDAENHVRLTGQTLNGADDEQMSKAATIYAGVSSSYSTGGSANAITLSPLGLMKGPFEYQTRLKVWFVPANSNTGAATVNVDGLGLKDIEENGAALTGGELVAGKTTLLEYDGTVFNVIYREGQGGVDDVFGLTGTVTIDALTDDPAPGTDFVVAVEDPNTPGTFFKVALSVLGLGATSEFPSGTRMLFQQTAVPTGWTKEGNATYNNAAIRGATGTVTTNNGSAFTNVFKNNLGLDIDDTIAGGTIVNSGTTGGHALTEAENGQHTHTVSDVLFAGTGIDTGSGKGFGASNTGSSGSGTAHTHPASAIVSTFTGGAHAHTGNVDLNIDYFDVVIGIKD